MKYSTVLQTHQELISCPRGGAFSAISYPAWWGICHFLRAIKTNPHLYPAVGWVGVYFDWCITSQVWKVLKTFLWVLNKCRLKDVRAHCYCASLVVTLFIRQARATSFSSARTESKTQQNIELMTFVLAWCANIFVGCSVTPTFFWTDHFLSLFFPLY